MAEIRHLLEQRIHQFREGLGSAPTPLHNVRNRHLDLPLVAKICRHPALVERLAALLGPDLLLWRSNFFIQSALPHDGCRGTRTAISHCSPSPGRTSPPNSR